MNDELPFALLVAIFSIIIFGSAGFSWGLKTATNDFQQELIKLELAEFVVDSTTGDTTFIINGETK